MALQDLIGHAYLLSDQRASDAARRDETAHWKVRGAPPPASRRLSAPSRRVARAHMPRRIFLALVLGWLFALAGLLTLIIALRSAG